MGRAVSAKNNETSPLFCYGHIEIWEAGMRLFDNAPTPAKPLREVRLTAINFIADAVNRTLDLKEIADNALHAIIAVTELDAGAVFTWHEADQTVRLFAWRGMSEAFARQVTVLRKGDDATIDSVLD